MVAEFHHHFIAVVLFTPTTRDVYVLHVVKP
jgi:hypothetical protein